MKLISVVLLCFLVKGIANLPATSKPTTAQAYLNNAQQYINSVSNSNVQVPKVSTPIGNTVVNPPALPTVQTTKAPTTTTKAPTTTTKAPTTTTKAPTTTTKAPTTTTTTTPVPVTTTTKAPTTSEPVTTTKAPALTTVTPITTKTPETITTKIPETTTVPSSSTASSTTTPCSTTTITEITSTKTPETETTTTVPSETDAPTSGTIVLSERLEEVLTQLLILLSEFVKTTNCVETSELLHQLIIQLSGELHIANTSENDESTTIGSGGTSTTTSAEVVINPDQIRVIVIQIKDLIDQSNLNANNEEIYDVINQLIHILTEGSAVGGKNTLDPPDHSGEIGTSNEKTDTSKEKTGNSDSESDTTTNVPCTSTPDIIPTKTAEITTISCETETSSPASFTSAPGTTTTLPVTTTCEPTVHDDPTSGTIVLSERLEEVLTELLILLSEFVKTTNCEETNELLHPLMIQLSDELHITSTFDSTSDGNETELENDDSTTINPDEIRVTLIQIKDIINQPNVTAASEEICDVIAQLISILTKESEVGVTSNVVSPDHNEDITKSDEQTDTSNDKTGTSNGQTDTSDSETGSFNEGTGISGEDTLNSEKRISNEEAGTDNSNEGKITSNEEKDTSNTIIDQPIQIELPIEGSNSNNNDLGPSDNDATLNSSQIDQLLSRLTDLITDANELIDDVTGQLIPQLINILTNWEDLFDGSNTIIATIAGSEQIKDLINLLTPLLNQTNEIANIDATNQIIKDLLNLLTIEGNDIEDVNGTNGTNDKDGHNTATTTNSDSANGQISFEINEIVSQLEQLNNQSRTTTANRKIDELIKQLEDQLIRTPTNNGPAWHEAVNQLITDIKKVQTQPINTKTNTQMKQLLNELVGKFTGVKNGNYPEDSIENLMTNYDDFMALLKQRQEQREARRKELAAIRAQQLAELAAQRKMRQQSYNDSMASLKKRQEQREAQRQELAAIRAQELADRAAERKMQQQSYNEPAYCVEDLTKSSDDFRASLKKRQEQREAQHKEFAAIRAQMLADQKKKTSQPNYERQTVPPTTKPNAPQTQSPTPLLTAPPTPLLTAPPTAKPTASPTVGSSTSSNTTKKSNQLLSGLLSSLF